MTIKHSQTVSSLIVWETTNKHSKQTAKLTKELTNQTTRRQAAYFDD